MGKFLKKATFFIAPVLLCFVATEILLRHIPNNYAFKNDYLESHSDEIETLYLGNSHIYFGVNPQYAKPKSFNAAYISQSLNCDLALLEKFDGHWKNLKRIIVPVDYLTLYMSLEVGPERWRLKNYNIYYGLNLSYAPADHFEIANGKLKENLRRIRNYYQRGHSDLSCNPYGWGTEYRSDDNHDLESSGEKAAKRHTAADDSLLSQNTEILEKLAEFAEKRNIRITLITSPAYPSYTKRLDPTQLGNTISAVQTLLKKHPEIRYFNFLNDPSFEKKDFYDGDHFNEIGAKKFTLKLEQLISNPNR